MRLHFVNKIFETRKSPLPYCANEMVLSLFSGRRHCVGSAEKLTDGTGSFPHHAQLV